MWKPWEWSRRSNEAAVDNARSAATVLARRSVERHEVEIFLLQCQVVEPRPGAVTRPA